MGTNNGPLLRLRGIKGFFEGEERMLRRGEELVVGRSRGADLSLRMASKFLERSDRNELRGSKAYRSVSRRHVRIAFYRTDHIVVEDLSANGTYVDGERVDGKMNLQNLADGAHIVALGSVERFRLELLS